VYLAFTWYFEVNNIVMKSKLIFFSILSVLIVLVSCNKEELTINRYAVSDFELMSAHLNIPSEPLNYDMVIPSALGAPVSFNSDKATLGRVLFYDTDLSSDKTISCASCHKQELGFSDDVAFSEGVLGNHSLRNSMSLGSVLSFQVYYQSILNPSGIPFLWDNSASSADELSKNAFSSENEMGMHMDEVVNEVNSKDYYEPLVKAAYGSENINETDLLDAVSEFVRSIGSFNSRFDNEFSPRFANSFNMNAVMNDNWSSFTDEENVGKAIYMSDCTGCHSPINARPTVLAANNGLYMDYPDKGIIASGYEDHFKVPTLRNLKFSAPYMHDGSLATLDDVIEHYSTGVVNTEHLSSELKSGNSPIHRNYTQGEKDALKAFLLTMTDNTLLEAERYSDPFK